LARRKVLAPLARRDIKDLADYIGAQDSTAALQLVGRIEKTIELPTQRPHGGPPAMLPFSLPMRRMSVPPYVPTETELIVFRVLHASRDLADPALFDQG
jgi:plasmid stabilization system protein ParE